MRIEAGLLDDAARDGLVLATRHGDAEGWAREVGLDAGDLTALRAVLG
jgi:hypothetical protein